MKSLYTVSSTQELISYLIDRGYDMIQLREGTLGVGDAVMLAPSENMYNFVIREVALNSWSSAQTIRRTLKISRALQAEIDAALEAQEIEESA